MRIVRHEAESSLVWGYSASSRIRIPPTDLIHAVQNDSIRHVFCVGAHGTIWSGDLLHKLVAENSLRKVSRFHIIIESSAQLPSKSIRFIQSGQLGLNRRISFDFPLYGTAIVYDRTVGQPGRFASLEQLARTLHSANQHLVRIIVPLNPETVSTIFDLWHRLVQGDVPFRFTLGDWRKSTPASRKILEEMLDNLAHHDSTPAADQYLYFSWRKAVSCGDMPSSPATVEVVGDEKLVRDKLENGSIALQPNAIDLKWWLSRFARAHKIVNVMKLARGGFELLDYRIRPTLQASSAAVPRAGHTPPKILFIGWYGTETAGDKAILGGLLDTISRKHPDFGGMVASLRPYYTQKTLLELGHSAHVEAVPYDRDLVRGRLPEVNMVVVAGGPLMDLVELADLLMVLKQARKRGIPIVIAGCGIGPVRWPIARGMIRLMLQMADRIVLRDEDSVEQAKSLLLNTRNIESGLDPSLAYLSALSIEGRLEVEQERPVLGLGVRAWQRKFARHIPREDFSKAAAQLPSIWAAACDHFIQATDGSALLIPMHTLHVGGDDRWIQAETAARSSRPDRIHCLTGSYSAKQVAERIAACDVILSMRYHSLLFATVMHVPTVILDYTGGGKVAAFANQAQLSAPIFDLMEITAEQLSDAILKTYTDRERIRGDLRNIAPELVKSSSRAATACVDTLDNSQFQLEQAQE